MIKTERLMVEKKDISENTLSENIGLLALCEDTFPSLSERQRLIISCHRMYNAGLSNDFDRF